MSNPEVRIALAGNPNSGKTSIFNALTGSRRNVGNYPGVTVEKKGGFFKHNGREYEILDLPGTYSLTSYSPEERIARREILNGGFDVSVVVVDSTNLRRNLYLLTQVMLAEANIVLCLNMSDEAEKSGQKLDLEQMKALLGVPIVETVGNRAIGIDKLKDVIDYAVANPSTENRLVLGDRLDQVVDELASMIVDEKSGSRPPRWLAVKILEGDEQTERWIRDRMPDLAQSIIDKAQILAAEIEEETALDIATYIADRHYGFVNGLLKEIIIQEARGDSRIVSDQIDAVLCDRVFGPLFFMLAMYLLFYLTFTVGDYPMGWIEAGFGWLGDTISGFWPEGSASPLKSLIVDGIIGGVGGVVVFLPNVVLLFLGLAFLEDSGYMSRAAFLVDKVMHKFGLHGKSFIPMMTGFGCTIPGIMATRTLENERDRLTTMMVLPLMSCGARMPIWMLLIPAFFPGEWRAPMLFFIYIFGIVLAAVLAKVLRVTVLKGEETPFVMELPPYRVPTFKAMMTKMGERSWLYLRKAGTIILAISIVLWAISSYPKLDESKIETDLASGKISVVTPVLSPDMSKEEKHTVIEKALEKEKNKVGANVEVITSSQFEQRKMSEELDYSIAGRIGSFLEPVLSPMGFDTRISTALIGAFAAKEVFVAQMGIVFSLGETDQGSQSLRDKLAEAYNPAIALSLMIFLLVATPCMATVAVTRRESGSWKWAMLQLFGLTLLAWIISTIVYQVGRLFL